MSEGLKALKDIRTWFGVHDYDQHKELDIIEKELKALEIIKNKQVQINRLNRSHSAKQYNLYLPKEMHLTQEEYDLLKEVLG